MLSPQVLSSIPHRQLVSSVFCVLSPDKQIKSVAFKAYSGGSGGNRGARERVQAAEFLPLPKIANCFYLFYI